MTPWYVCFYIWIHIALHSQTNIYSWLITVSLLYLVDGNWSKWGKWSDCSAKCGGGTRKRRRRCNNPKPKKGGKKCSGKNRELEKCNTFSCWGKSGRFICAFRKAGLWQSKPLFFLTVICSISPSQGWPSFWKSNTKFPIHVRFTFREYFQGLIWMAYII